jgi:hypothetical protein
LLSFYCVCWKSHCYVPWEIYLQSYLISYHSWFQQSNKRKVAFPIFYF